MGVGSLGVTMEVHSLETWLALAEVDPVGTFDKLALSLELPYHTAQLILTDHDGIHLAACKYILEKYKDALDLHLDARLDILHQYSKEPMPYLPTIPPKPVEPYYIPKQTTWGKIIEGAGTILAIIILLLCAIAFIFYNSFYEDSYDIPEPTDAHNYDPAMRYESYTSEPLFDPYDPAETITDTGCPNGCETPPPDCDIKGNISFDGEKIYHVPGQDFYSKTTIDPVYGERWFCTEAEAITNGWRKAYQ